MRSEVLTTPQRRRPNPEEDLGVESKIELRKVVANIQWNQDRAHVRCLDGSEYSAEFVVFTPSLGVLKARHEGLFTPRLPDWKVNAIEHMGWGTLEKFYLEFEVPFWPQNSADWVMFKILWTAEDEALAVSTGREWLEMKSLSSNLLLNI